MLWIGECLVCCCNCESHNLDKRQKPVLTFLWRSPPLCNLLASKGLPFHNPCRGCLHWSATSRTSWFPRSRTAFPTWCQRYKRAKWKKHQRQVTAMKNHQTNQNKPPWVCKLEAACKQVIHASHLDVPHNHSHKKNAQLVHEAVSTANLWARKQKQLTLHLTCRGRKTRHTLKDYKSKRRRSTAKSLEARGAGRLN